MTIEHEHALRSSRAVVTLAVPLFAGQFRVESQVDGGPQVKPRSPAVLRLEVGVVLGRRAGLLRLLISDIGTLDRALEQPRTFDHSADLDTQLTQARRQHPADRVFCKLAGA